MPNLTMNGKVFCHTFDYHGDIFVATEAAMTKINEITEPIQAHVYVIDYLLPLINAGEVIQIGGQQ